MTPSIYTPTFSTEWGINIKRSPGYRRALEIKKAQIAMNTFNRFCDIAAHIVDFERLDDTIDDRVVRQSLLWYPLTVFFVVGNHTMCLPGLPTGRGWNVNGNFGSACAIGMNGRTYQIKLRIPGGDDAPILTEMTGYDDYPFDYEGVAIRANDNCYPFINTVLYYTENIADILLALENDKILLQHPIDFHMTQRQMKTAIKWMADLKQGSPFMYTPKMASNGQKITDSMEVVNFMEGGNLLKPAMEALDWNEQRFFAECGVKNAGSQVDKKGENLTMSEVHSSDDVTNVVRQGKVDYINDQMKKMGVLELPGMASARCVIRKGVQEDDDVDDVQRMDRKEGDPVAGDAAGD